ncbi:MAG TPA: ABC transporter ATP-binding protein [Actinomycetota bacterium]|nr:ABC transporter ATP-binding protein [Actinomycetota bacterium]
MSDVAVADRGVESSDASAAVSLDGVVKRFGDVVAVDGVDLEVRQGEFFSMLGPSGSGKTTCLRMIAGFERPTEGRVLLGGIDVGDLPPYERDVNTVFQDYALFPHMTVLDNVAYGLMVRKVAKAERTARANEALEMVRLSGFGGRKPGQLSGGQRQRVALARALIMRPSVLLLDEPLGALDLKLRQAMQVELKEIQQAVGLTFIYVTHDQEEALTMSDRLAVFNRGRVEQVGTPADVYERPSTGFVAGFVGVSNLLTGDAALAIVGSPVPVSIRPEKIHLVLDADSAVAEGECTATGVVSKVVYLGAVTRYVVALDEGGELVVMQQNLRTSSMEALQVQGRRVRLTWQRQHTRDMEPAVGSSRAPIEGGTGSSGPGEEDA